MRKILRKKEKKLVSISEARTRATNFTVRHSNHYSILPSLNEEDKIAYIKEMLKKIFELEKKS